MILPLDSKLEPVIFHRHWIAINDKVEYQAIERKRCAVEPWYWLVNYVYSIQKDEAVEGGVTMRFPAHEYLRYIAHKFFTEPHFALDKSRQLLLTWLFSALYLWYIQYNHNEECVCQSKKEDIADTEIVQRADFIYQNEPCWLTPVVKYRYCKLFCPATNSKMLGIPSGGDQIRSKNPTRVYIDEAGFFEGEFEDCRTAAIACCKDVKLVSTPNAGQWDMFIHDKLVA